ncbi:hypothetical protein WJX74_006931 [Apatococcus lobatus]|uniref:Uncharacterized protein n=1 Tax=Apatococcus lobatus TaxID=904363 RepID=A0AAW1Q5L8_9CHLO
MSRTISRGTCSVRPGNDELSLALYPIYHAFTSATNLHDVMLDVAHDHSTMARFDPQMMRALAEEVYGMSEGAQAAEGRVRRDNSLLAGEVKALNAAYRWPLLRRIAADWAPMVRGAFLDREGQLLGDRALYGAAQETSGTGAMSDELIRSRLGIATDQQRCPTAEIPMTRWPVQAAAGTPPTLAAQAALPARPQPPMGQRGTAPGFLSKTERVLPGPVAVALCTQGACRR